MDQEELRQRFAALTTAHIADGCIRTGVPVRCAPPTIQAVLPNGRAVLPSGLTARLAGRVLPARHAGSVDVFLDALQTRAERGDVLVVDNGGRTDEACVGDLIALEARAAGLGGIVIWGLHRDTADIVAIGLPVFSMGAIPTGPLTLRETPRGALDAATVGEWTVTSADLVLGDDDGVLFIPAAGAGEVLAAAERIRDTERRQADRIRSGITLRAQVKFADYLTARAQRPGLTFREHLRTVGGAIEE
jgi:regulator of RNase E activity RraA